MNAADDLDADAAATGLDLSTCALAVAIDADRLATALVTRLGEIVAAQRIRLPNAGAGDSGPSAGELLRTVTSMLDDVLHAAGVESAEVRQVGGIGVSIDGDVDGDAGTVTLAGSAAWQAFPLRDALAERYPIASRLLDAAVATTIGEHWRGAARGRRTVLGLVIGDRVGGGLLTDGRLFTGTTGNAGHIGHISTDPFGATCRCGGCGCLETVAGGLAIAGWAAGHGFPVAQPTAAVVAEAALRGEPVARATFRRAGEAIGFAVASAVTLLDLDVVVIGGPVALVGGSALFEPVADAFARYAGLGYASQPRVVPALLGVDGPLVGAAAAVQEPALYPLGHR